MKEQTFINACIDGDIPLVRRGLKRHNPNNQKLLSLRMACEWGHRKVIKLLLEDHRIDPAGFGNIALIHAKQSKQFGMMRILLKDDRVVAGCIKNDQRMITEEDQRRIFEEKPHLLV